MKISLIFLSVVLSLYAVPSARADEASRASKILTAELAQKIIGLPVEAGGSGMADTEIGQTWVSRVSYHAKTGAASAPEISLLIRHAAAAADAKTIFESSKATFHGEDVSALGAAAYRTKNPAQLDILKGANWLIISAGTFKNPDPVLQGKAAREILAKISD